MRKLLIFAAAAALLANASPGFASTYTFSVSGSATFSPRACTTAPCTDTISGDFTINTSVVFPTDPNTSIDITVSGNTDPGTYDIPTSWSTSIPPFTTPTLITDYVGVGASNNVPFPLTSEVQLYFSSGLDPAALTQVEICPNGGGCYISSATTGSAVLTPLSPSATLFATGLALLGFMGFWRKKRMGLNLTDAHLFR